MLTMGRWLRSKPTLRRETELVGIAAMAITSLQRIELVQNFKGY